MSRNPYQIDGSPPTLQHSVFALMDILGYSDLIAISQANGTQKAMLSKLHESLSKGRQWLDGKHSPEILDFGSKDHFALKAFTDNIAFAGPFTAMPNRNLEPPSSTLAHFSSR